MNQKSKTLSTVLIVVACVAVIMGIKYYKHNQNIQLSEGRSKGNPEATVKIVEYIDFQCPACAMGAKYLKEYMTKNPQDIHLEMKYFPLRMHSHAVISARFTECASQQNKFWEFHDQLIDNQNDWKKLTNAYPSFLVMAEELKLDMTKMDACLRDDKIGEIITSNKKEGKKLGVRSTPTYFVNGKLVVGFKNLKEEITKILGE